MSLGPYTFIGPLWWQALPLCSYGFLGPSHVFSDLPTTATYVRYLPDLSLSRITYTIISPKILALDPLSQNTLPKRRLSLRSIEGNVLGPWDEVIFELAVGHSEHEGFSNMFNAVLLNWDDSRGPPD
ncbi:hypothetical protein M405DRAFT_880182 [Rhizopogon salebrosus TDB-379]|nr:hypothetical protein M405DRAFT_880182 [Rhizopogon salebrosus TDB-379]